MKQILNKLRMGRYILMLQMQIFWLKITTPFRVFKACVKRYLELRNIDNMTEDSWERYVEHKKLEENDKLMLKREQFFCLKSKMIGAFFIAAMFAGFYALKEEKPNEIDEVSLRKMGEFKENFQNEKERIVESIKEFDNYEEVRFDENLKAELLAWEFETYKSLAELDNFEQRFSLYMGSLDIIKR